VFETRQCQFVADWHRLDDIEDSSDLRRGHPATHTVFGAPSTINSANFLLIDVMNDIQKLNSPRCMGIAIEELRNLFIGQSFDLHWTEQGECPSEAEYLEMINQSQSPLLMSFYCYVAKKY
jgi:geranylgeranyl pyrophosphate synthase